MKRLSFVLMLLVSVIITVSAQTSQLATLLHEGQMSVFYGATALKEAHEAAVAGDVITLSAGQFNACDITKPLTIRGSGMGLAYATNFTAPTYITGNFTINIPNNEEHTFTFESIRHDNVLKIKRAYDMNFIKCMLKSIELHGTTKDCKLIHCDVHSLINKVNTSVVTTEYLSVSASNSRVYLTAGGYASYMTFSAYNCVLTYEGDAYKAWLNNCVITGFSTSKLATSSAAYYCVWYGLGAKNPFPYEPEGDTNTRLDHENVFKEGTFYELTDELKALKTTDGTQVGIYGGNMPFDPTTTVPQISKFSVSPRTSADGKLSIDIEVEGIKQ